jgi:Trypsin-co-occurring domain 2
MEITSQGVPVEELVTAVKDSIKQAGVSSSSDTRDLQVRSVQLTLHVVAIASAGGRLDFRVPFIGMKLSVGTKVTRQDTHTIEMTLVPPDRTFAVRGDVEQALVDAINTIRRTMAAAAGGDDPFVLSEGTVEIAFAVTREGSISLGVTGDLSSEVTHTLRLGLEPASN